MKLKITLLEQYEYTIPIEKIVEDRAGYRAEKESEYVDDRSWSTVYERERRFGLENPDTLLGWVEQHMTWHELWPLVEQTYLDYDHSIVWMDDSGVALEIQE